MFIGVKKHLAFLKILLNDKVLVIDGGWIDDSGEEERARLRKRKSNEEEILLCLRNCQPVRYSVCFVVLFRIARNTTKTHLNRNR